MDKKTEVPQTRYHRLLNILSRVLLIGTFAYLLLMWKHIPDRIPAHFDGAGEINRWGGKYELIFCPVISVLMYLFIGFLEKYPEVWNTGVTITLENRDRIYSILKNMIVTLKFILILIFSFITINSSLARPLPGWFTAASLLMIFGPMVYFMILLFLKK